MLILPLESGSLYMLRKTNDDVGVADLQIFTAFLFRFLLETKKTFKVKLNTRKVI